jgi:hypothetical protein
VQVVKELDDHADIVAVEIVTDTTQYGGKSANLVSGEWYFLHFLYCTPLHLSTCCISRLEWSVPLKFAFCMC